MNDAQNLIDYCCLETSCLPVCCLHRDYSIRFIVQEVESPKCQERSVMTDDVENEWFVFIDVFKFAINLTSRRLISILTIIAFTYLMLSKFLRIC